MNVAVLEFDCGSRTVTEQPGYGARFGQLIVAGEPVKGFGVQLDTEPLMVSIEVAVSGSLAVVVTAKLLA